MFDTTIEQAFWRCRCVNYTSGSVVTKIVQ